MWRSGILDLSEARIAARSRDFSRRVALTRLEDLKRNWNPDDEVLLSRLYDEVVVGGNVYKTTRRNRFSDVDARIVEESTTRYSSKARLEVHDVGASNAITSLDLYRALTKSRPSAVHASDFFECLYLVSLNNSSWICVLDGTGRSVQFISPKFVLGGDSRESKRFPVNVGLRAWLHRRLLPRAQELFFSIDRQCSQERVQLANGHVQRQPLWHPECQLLAAKDSNFTLGHHDLFSPSARSFDVVRTMNVLNPNYFPEPQIKVAIATLVSSLVEGGLFILGRTIEEKDGHNRASAFVRNGVTMDRIWALNGGAENEHLVAEASGMSVNCLRPS